MLQLLADSVSKSKSGKAVVQFMYWRLNKSWEYPTNDFTWIRRWTRIGPDGGNTDTVLGAVSIDKLNEFLADKEVGQEFSFNDLVNAGVATRATNVTTITN